MYKNPNAFSVLLASHTFEEACQKFCVEHERIPLRTPNMNEHIEAFHSILEEGCFRRNVFDTYSEAYEMLSEFMFFYNERRIYASIGYRSPKEFYELESQGIVQTKEIRV